MNWMSKMNPTRQSRDDPSDSDDDQSETPPTGVSVLSDEDLIQKATTAANRQNFESLYTASWPSPTLEKRYDSKRAAELALFVHLRWWARHDLSQVTRLFKRSDLHEGDWAEKRDHYRGLLAAAGDLLGDDCYDPRHGDTDA